MLNVSRAMFEEPNVIFISDTRVITVNERRGGTHPIWRQAEPGWMDHRLAGWPGSLAPGHVPPTSWLAAADFPHLFIRC